MANLLESYKGRLSIAEKQYGQQNGGAKLSNQKKMVTAMCLNNISKFMNEAFANSVGTQRSDLGKFKVFALDITTLAMPNLIINDIFMVVPMSSFTGYLTFMEYALGTEKGGAGGEAELDPYHNAMAVYDGDHKAMDMYGDENNDWRANNIINSPFKGFGEMNDDRQRYTGERIVESLKAGEEISWTPIKKGTLPQFKADGSEGEWEDMEPNSEGKFIAEADGKVRYIYDNQYIPQKALPTVVGRMQGIALTARARRIAVYYSQIAAFQSKNDYGLDFESQIAQQAQAELQYEIDAEAVFLVKREADRIEDKARALEWIDEELDTISYSMKAESFAKKIEEAKAGVYMVTKRFLPNWMLVGPMMMPVLQFVPGFKAANASVANGAYIAGDIAGMKVIVSPLLGKECILGVLAGDGKTATGVYAPYMPIVPTQLLGFADGTMSQGFSTLYDMKLLNPLLLAHINVINGNNMFLGRVELVKDDESSEAQSTHKRTNNIKESA